MNSMLALFIASISFGIVAPSVALGQEPVPNPQGAAESKIERPVVITVLPFYQPDDLGVDLAAVVNSDLNATASIRMEASKDLNELLKATHEDESSADFSALRVRGIQFVVTGTALGSNLRFRLYQLEPNRQLLAFDIPVLRQSAWRYAAHQVSDLVFEKITGIKGAANTKMAFVEMEGGRYEQEVQSGGQ